MKPKNKKNKKVKEQKKSSKLEARLVALKKRKSACEEQLAKIKKVIKELE